MIVKVNTPGRIRTCDLRIRNPLLYPTELRAQELLHRMAYAINFLQYSHFLYMVSTELLKKSRLLRRFAPRNDKQSAFVSLRGHQRWPWQSLNIPFEVFQQPLNHRYGQNCTRGCTKFLAQPQEFACPGSYDLSLRANDFRKSRIVCNHLSTVLPSSFMKF